MILLKNTQPGYKVISSVYVTPLPIAVVVYVRISAMNLFYWPRNRTVKYVSSGRHEKWPQPCVTEILGELHQIGGVFLYSLPAA